MKVLTWILQIILIAFFAVLGGQKVFMPIPDLIAQGMLWIEDFPVWQVRAIAILEVLGALGLVLPHLVKALPKILVPLAAGGLGLTMIGAVVTHVLRGDPALSIAITTVFTLISFFVAYRRYREVGSAA